MQQGEKKKAMQIGNEVMLSVFTDMIIYIETSVEFTKKLMETWVWCPELQLHRVTMRQPSKVKASPNLSDLLNKQAMLPTHVLLGEKSSLLLV